MDFNYEKSKFTINHFIGKTERGFAKLFSLAVVVCLPTVFSNLFLNRFFKTTFVVVFVLPGTATSVFVKFLCLLRKQTAIFLLAVSIGDEFHWISRVANQSARKRLSSLSTVLVYTIINMV